MEESSTPSRFSNWMKENRWLLSLAFAALAVRFGYFFTVFRDPFYNYFRHIPDAYFYNNWALDMVANRWWFGGPEVFIIGPFFGFLLAAIYGTIGPHLVLVRILFILLDVGTVLFIYGFGRRIWDETVGRVAALIWICYLPAIFFTSQLLPVTVDLFLLAAALYFAARGAEGNKWLFVPAGVAVGLFTLDRPNALLFVAAAAIAFMLYRKKLGWLRPLLFVAPIAVLVFAFTLRNYLVTGDWVVISSQGGVNFFIGNSERANGFYWNLGDIGSGRPEELNKGLAARIAENAERRLLKPTEVSRWWTREALKWIRENPADAARLYVRKLWIITNDFEVSLNVDFYYLRFVSFFHWLPLPWFGFVLPFGILGLVFRMRRLSFPAAMAAVFILSYGASVMAFFIASRYRIPLALGLTPFAGAGFMEIVRAWRAWRWRRGTILTAVVIVLGFASIYPCIDIKRDQSFGQTDYRYGKYYTDEGQYERAIPLLRRATRRAPEVGAAFYELGFCYEKAGQTDTALQTYYEGTVIHPEAAYLHYGYGDALRRVGMVSQSIGPLMRAVTLDPSLEEAWYSLGEAFVAVRDYNRAAGCFVRVAELLPEDADMQLRCAELMGSIGDANKAELYARRALKISPRMPRANFIIGRALFDRGAYAEAIPFLKAEAEISPQDPASIAFLVLTADKLGDSSGAAAYYEAYLESGGAPDPEFERKLR